MAKIGSQTISGGGVHSDWQNILSAIPLQRSAKPRSKGLTMLLDRTLDLAASAELISFVGNYVDQVKLSFGTSVLIDDVFLAKKLDIFAAAGIEVFPGGSLFEIAFLSGQSRAYFKKVKSLGFRTIEISDGMIELPSAARKAAINEARMHGFKVMTEVGKKDPNKQIAAAKMGAIACEDLECGADYVIVEARESGSGVGIFDSAGKVKEDDVSELIEACPDRSKIMWEAPQKAQQAYLINRFGQEVNLGNIAPADTLGLEALRRGLRWDTFENLQIKPAA